MQIAVCSDAHGARRQMDAFLLALPKVDAVCFLGDMDKDATYLDYGVQEMRPGAVFYAVAGNNDPFSTRAGTIIMNFDGVRTLLTHGHLFRVKSTLETLAQQARRSDCALALYGHTHKQRDELVDGVRLVNPGTLMYGEWALLTLEAGRIEVTLHNGDEVQT